MVYSPQALVLVHNRELANQIDKVLNNVIKRDKKVYKNIKSCLIKAESYVDLQYGGQILITTPGVLKNLLGIKSTIDIKNEKGETEEILVNVQLNEAKIIAIDEADEVYAIDSHAYAMTDLVKKIAPTTTILILSATLTPRLVRFVEDNFTSRKVIKKEIKAEKLTVETIKQTYLDMEESSKIPALIAIFERVDIQCQTIIFVNTRNFADKLCEEFKKNKLDAFVLHKDLGIDRRDKAINDFLDGKIKILITTNLLARGIDNREVSFVINAELPTSKKEDGRFEVDYNSYLHRVGRTGRFALEGLALNITTDDKTRGYIKDLERHFKMEVTKIEKIGQIDTLLKEVAKYNKTPVTKDSF